MTNTGNIELVRRIIGGGEEEYFTVCLNLYECEWFHLNRQNTLHMSINIIMYIIIVSKRNLSYLKVAMKSLIKHQKHQTLFFFRAISFHIK